MVKELVSAALSAMVTAAIAVNAAAGDYYTSFAPHRQVMGTQLIYEEYDISHLEELADKTEELISEPDHGMDLSVYLDELYKELLKAHDASTLAQLASDRRYNNESVSASLDAAEISLKAFRRFDDAVMAVYKSDYEPILEDVLGEGKVESYIASMHTAQYYKLVNEEKLLVSSYNDKLGDSDACANLFIKLVALRNSIAAEEGCDNYAEYANKIIYNRGYTAEEISAYESTVAKYIAPLYKSLAEMRVGMSSRYLKRSDADIISEVGDIVGSINGDLKSAYDYMINNKLYDIECSSEKAEPQGAYTSQLYTYRTPYLFMSYKSDSDRRIRSFIHETGHFCALLNHLHNDSVFDGQTKPLSVDTCELQSQGLEALSERFYGRLFGSGAAYERADLIFTLLGNIIDGCYYNEWQELIYSEPELSVGRANELAASLFEKYYGRAIKSEAAQKLWTDTAHNFHSPMYYLSYSVSAAAALSLYANDDYSDSADKYMRVSAAGCDIPFSEVLSSADMDSIFNEEVLRAVADEINGRFALSYSDVDYDGWYMPYIYQVSAIYDGKSDTEFEPQADITREDFVKLIGRMQDYYIGIDGNYKLTFKDVSISSDSAEYIMWANANGIVKGYTDTQFGGDDSMSREQLVTVLYRMSGNDSSPEEDKAYDSFADSDQISEWAEEAVSWAVEKGIISGRENNEFAPKATATRAEAAKIVSCCIDLMY